MTQERWRALSEWPLTACALLFLAAYAWSVIADLRGAAQEAAEWTMWGIWLVFVVDYVVNLVLAPRRWHWFVRHLGQFVVVVLPLLRPLRLLRLLTLWTVLQRAGGKVVRGRVTVYVAGSALLLLVIAALAELEAERHAPHATITSFGKALWWAAATMTTVGYGDAVPVTFEGRLIAVGLMVSGIALLGVVTATLASWMSERAMLAEQLDTQVTIAHIEALGEQIRRLTEQVEALGGRPAQDGDEGQEPAAGPDPGATRPRAARPVSSRAPSGGGGRPARSRGAPRG
jgi:voltage-gated potassium channel